MIFIFSKAIQAGIDSGIYEVVKNSAGVALGIARNKATGQFVGHAIGAVAQPFLALAPLQIGLSGMQMAQTHLGFQKTYRMLDNVLNSVALLQASTALIGVGTVAGVALSAVNIWQTLKLREDIKQLRLEVKNGFIDLKQALHDQNAEILQRIDRMAEDIQFKHHQMILVVSHGKFIGAINCLKNALKVEDMDHKNAVINMAEGMLQNALADYNNPDLCLNTSAAGQLRRMECSWVMDQMITTIYQLKGAHQVVSDRLFDLRKKIGSHKYVMMPL